VVEALQLGEILGKVEVEVNMARVEAIEGRVVEISGDVKEEVEVARLGAA